MAENLNNVIENDTPTGNEQDYIKALQELKQSTVSKEDYKKLQDDNARLIEALKNGDSVNLADTEEKKDIGELRKELFQGLEGGVPNLEMAKRLVNLRNEILKDEKAWDPALPNGKGYKFDPYDQEQANQVFELMEYCIEYADGDEALFTQEFQRHIRDDGSMRRKK